MFFFHPLSKLKIPTIKIYNGVCNDLLKTFQDNNWRVIYNLFLRGQSGQPIRQRDADTAEMTMRAMLKQRLAEKAARIKSLKQETEDLLDQLSKPFELEKPNTPFLDKAFSTWGKIQKLRGKNGK